MPKDGFEFKSSIATSGDIVLAGHSDTLIRYIETTILPTISGSDSANYVFEDTQNHDILTYQYSVDGAVYFDATDFKTHYPNLYNFLNDRMFSVYYRVVLKSGYKLDTKINVQGQITLPTLQKVAQINDAPKVTGTSTTDYTLPANDINRHATFKYRGPKENSTT